MFWLLLGHSLLGNGAWHNYHWQGMSEVTNLRAQPGDRSPNDVLQTRQVAACSKSSVVLGMND